MIYDVLIVGAGPSGITASIKLKKLGYKVALLECSMPGGKVNIAPRVDNYPNYKEILGPDLAMVFFNRMNEAGLEFIPTKVSKINKDHDLFKIDTTSGLYESRVIVVASGTDEKKLDLPHEKELLGHGLSYCAICDGHFFKNQDVVVVAEDKYAISEAIYLSSLASHVTVITSLSHLKGDKRLLDELASKANVSYLYNKKVVSLNGYPLDNITLDNGQIVSSKGIFPLLGYIPNTSFLDKSLLNEDGFINVNRDYMSKLDGLFAIGDVINRELKQIYLAEIDANKASENIDKYLKDHNNG